MTLVKHDGDCRIIYDCDSKLYSCVMCYFIALFLFAANKRYILLCRSSAYLTAFFIQAFDLCLVLNWCITCRTNHYQKGQIIVTAISTIHQKILINAAQKMKFFIKDFFSKKSLIKTSFFLQGSFYHFLTIIFFCNDIT